MGKWPIKSIQTAVFKALSLSSALWLWSCSGGIPEATNLGSFTPSMVIDQIIVDGGEQYTVNPFVRVETLAENVGDIYVTFNPDCASGGLWEPFRNNLDVSIPDSLYNSTLTVYVKFRNADEEETECFSASITHDNQPMPTDALSHSMDVPNNSITNQTEIELTISGLTGSGDLGVYADDNCESALITRGFDSSSDTAVVDLIALEERRYHFYTQFTDPAGNKTACIDSGNEVLIELAPPTVAFDSLSPAIINENGDAWFTFVYEGHSEITLTTSDLLLTGADNCSIQIIEPDDDTRQVHVSNCTDATGTVTVALPAATAVDFAGNVANEITTTDDLEIDNIRPSVAIGPKSTNKVNSASEVYFDLTYTGADSINLTNLMVDILTDSGSSAGCRAEVADTGINTARATISDCSSDGVLKVQILENSATDIAGNMATASAQSDTFVVDNTPPGVTVTKHSSSPDEINSAGTALFLVDYSDASTILLDGSTKATYLTITGDNENCTLGDVFLPADPTQREVQVTGCNVSEGNIKLRLEPGSARDDLNNPITSTHESSDFPIDNKGPEITIVGPTDTLGSPLDLINSAGTVRYTLNYSDVTGNATVTPATDLTITGASTDCSASIHPSSTATSVLVDISGCMDDGIIGLTVAAGTAADEHGNPAEGKTSASPAQDVEIDNTLPQRDVTPPGTTYTGLNQDLTWSIAFDSDDIVSLLEGSTYGITTTDSECTVSQGGTPPNFTFTVANCDDASNTGTFYLNANISTDDAGNQATPYNFAFTIDNTPPSITIDSVSAAAASSTASVNLSITRNDEFVNHIDSSKQITGNTTDCSLTYDGSDTLNLANCSLNGTATVVLPQGSIRDEANNPSAQVTQIVTLDNTGPIVDVIGPLAGDIYLGIDNTAVQYEITYEAETVSPNLTTGHLELIENAGNATDCSIGIVHDSGNRKYTVSIDDCSTTHSSLGLRLLAGTFQDPYGNQSQVHTSDTDMIVDRTPPIITISDLSGDSLIADGEDMTYTVTFADTYLNTSSLVVGTNLTVAQTAGCSVEVTGSHPSYSVRAHTCANSGTFGFTVLDDAVTDDAGNIAASDEVSATLTVDEDPPTIQITRDAGVTHINSSPPGVDYTVTFTDAHAVHLNNDTLVSILGGTDCSASVSGSGTTTRTVTVSGCTDTSASINLRVLAGAATDEAGNSSAQFENGAANRITTVDNVAPTPNITTSSAITASSNVTFNIAFDEDVTGTINTANIATSSNLVIDAGTLTKVNNQLFTIDANFNGSAANGLYQIQLGSGSITDIAGNGNVVSNTLEFRYNGKPISIVEDLDDSTLDGWTNQGTYSWAIQSGASPTLATGPEGAESGANYLLAEASSRSPGDEFILQSQNEVYAEGQTLGLSFDYHMYGSDMGSLKVQYDLNKSGSWTDLWTATGDQGDEWFSNSVSVHYKLVTAGEVRFRIVSTVGADHYSDIGIDNLEISGTIPSEPTPTAFRFVDVGEALFDSTVVSNDIAVNNIDATITVNVADGTICNVTLDAGCSSTVTDGGITVHPGNSIRLSTMSEDFFDKTKTVTVTAGLVTTEWNVTTFDTPTFAPISNAQPNSPVFTGATIKGPLASSGISVDITPAASGDLEVNAGGAADDVAIQNDDVLTVTGDSDAAQATRTYDIRFYDGGGQEKVVEWTIQSAEPAVTALWGANSRGQMNIAALSDPTAAINKVDSSENFAYVSTHTDHTCALNDSDELFCWGNNSVGQVGNGTTGEELTPIELASSNFDNNSINDVSVGALHTCAINSDGKLYCWGYNYFGQLGVSDNTDRNQPTLVGSGYQKVSAGKYTTCAIDNDGELYCWGRNESGQVGVNSLTSSFNSPQLVESSFWKWNDVAVGYDHTCAIRDDDDLYCWGNDLNEKLGNGGSSSLQRRPDLISSSKSWDAVAVGENHSCAETTNQIYCWGIAVLNGHTTEKDIPAKLSGIGNTGIEKVTIGKNHTCYEKSSGYWCFGNGQFAKLGNEEYSNQLSPVSVSGSFLQVAAGENHTCGILSSNNDLHCWGSKESRLGRDESAVFAFGANTDLNGVITTASLGHNVGCVAIDGTGPTCFGSHQYGQLGNNDESTPYVNGNTTSMALDLVSISNSESHSCGLASDGNAYCWGINYDYSISSAGSHFANPVQIPGTWMQISTGHSHSCGVHIDGKGYCWGDNYYGQIGNNSTVDAQNPTQVVHPSGLGWQKIVGGRRHSCGLDATGVIYCWGSNAQYFALGRGVAGSSLTPVKIASEQRFRSLVAGEYHNCAIDTEDTAFCWGSAFGTGDGTGTNKIIPVEVAGGHDWTTISARHQHTCGITTGNIGYCWGPNQYGQVTGPETETESRARKFTPFEVDTPNGKDWLILEAGYHNTIGVYEP